MDRYLDIKENLIKCANEDEDIKAIIAIGSSTREEVKADEYSDLDLFIVTEKVEKWYSGEYPELIGKVSVSFIEPTLGGGKERRCIYDDDRDVDMIIITPSQFEEALKEGIAGWVMNRGYKILYDVNSYEDMIKLYVKIGHSNPEISEDEFINMVNDFYFHNIWACKKLKRGELWSAKMCVDAYLKNYLLKSIELYSYEVHGTDVWHDGRFIDRWAEKSITDELKKCFAHYDKQDVMSALLATNSLFKKLTVEVATRKNYSYPDNAAECADKYLKNSEL